MRVTMGRERTKTTGKNGLGEKRQGEKGRERRKRREIQYEEESWSERNKSRGGN